MKTQSQEGFAIITAIILSTIFSVGLTALYHLSKSFGKTAVLYEHADYAESLCRSASTAAGEFIEQIMLDKVQPAGAMLNDVNIVTHDLLPSPAARWDDTPQTNPDLILDHGGGYQSRIDIDYVPLASGFSWTSIKFGMSYQEAAAGNTTIGSQTYRVHVLTTGPSHQRVEAEGIYVVTP